jgi:hypothetical protein
MKLPWLADTNVPSSISPGLNEMTLIVDAPGSAQDFAPGMEARFETTSSAPSLGGVPESLHFISK